MCSPIWTPFPSPSPSHPSGSSQCTSPEHLSHTLNLDWRSVSHMIIYLFQCYLLRSSHPRLLPGSYWSGLPFPSPEDLPDLWIYLRSPALQADSLLSYEGSPKRGKKKKPNSTFSFLVWVLLLFWIIKLPLLYIFIFSGYSSHWLT